MSSSFLGRIMFKKTSRGTQILSLISSSNNESNHHPKIRTDTALAAKEKPNLSATSDNHAETLASNMILPTTTIHLPTPFPHDKIWCCCSMCSMYVDMSDFPMIFKSSLVEHGSIIHDEKITLVTKTILENNTQNIQNTEASTGVNEANDIQDSNKTDLLCIATLVPLEQNSPSIENCTDKEMYRHQSTHNKDNAIEIMEASNNDNMNETLLPPNKTSNYPDKEPSYNYTQSAHTTKNMIGLMETSDENDMNITNLLCNETLLPSNKTSNCPDKETSYNYSQSAHTTENMIELMETSDENNMNTTNLLCNETLLPSNRTSPNLECDRDQENSFIEDSDDSVKDKNYVPSLEASHSSVSSDDEGAGRVNNSIDAFRDVEILPTSTDTQCLPPCENMAEASTSLDRISGIQYTKKGTVRKRKMHTLTKVERKQLKSDNRKEKFSIKTPCSEKCRKKCTLKISDERRQEINTEFWSFNREGQVVFVSSYTTKKTTARKTKEDSHRNYTYKYYLKSSGNNEKLEEVCRHFFLTTLGYHPKNDYSLLKALSNPLKAKDDKRGKHQKTPLIIDRQVIIEHVNKFIPAVSHYRRAHAPNKKYLPSDITVRLMYKHFTEQNPNAKCSYELYRNVVKKDMNISFVKLGNEECETCEYFNIHNSAHNQTPNMECDVCIKYTAHKLLVNKIREAYREDANKEQCQDNVYYSADLQKVIMLPRLDGFKSVIFCPRIIAFNESFVPLGSQKCNGPSIKPFAVIWHEAICGRKQEDIISAYRAFLINKRDIKNITLWVDNCGSQNKSWALFSFLVNIINTDEISADKITIKYFEPGHTFMSADHFHHQVELSMKRNPKLYDFNDFVEVVQASNSGKVIVKVMSVDDFYNYKDESSKFRLKNMQPRIYINEVIVAEVRRNYKCIFFKSCTNDSFVPVTFLKAVYDKNSLPTPKRKQTARGIATARKNEIIQTLGPLMPNNRLKFWNDLPINDLAVSLVDFPDYGDEENLE